MQCIFSKLADKQSRKDEKTTDISGLIERTDYYSRYSRYANITFFTHYHFKGLYAHNEQPHQIGNYLALYLNGLEDIY